jgi:hypothetical protein
MNRGGTRTIGLPIYWHSRNNDDKESENASDPSSTMICCSRLFRLVPVLLAGFVLPGSDGKKSMTTVEIIEIATQDRSSGPAITRTVLGERHPQMSRIQLQTRKDLIK